MKKSFVILAAAMLFSGVQAGDWGKAPIKNPISYGCDSPWRFSAEAMYFRAYDPDDNLGPQDHEFGYRFEFSYQGEGMGLRGRWFEFIGTDTVGQDVPTASALDIELFDQFELGPWQGEYSFGARKGKFKQSNNAVFADDFEGWGPTLGVELTRPITGPLSLYTGARVSILVGDDDAGPNGNSTSIWVTELFGGVQYAIGECGSRVRLGVEGQNWGNVIGGNEDVTLFGGVVEVQLAF